MSKLSTLAKQMKRKQNKKDVKQFTYRTLTFFLFVPVFLNLIGNLLAMSGQYTFYFLGYNFVAIASRFIENTIYNISWRVLLLGLLTLFSSAFMYFLYYHAHRGNKALLIVSVILYILDHLLVYTDLYMEGSSGVVISSFIHYFMMIFIATLALAYFLVKPLKRGKYDYA